MVMVSVHCKTPFQNKVIVLCAPNISVSRVHHNYCRKKSVDVQVSCVDIFCHSYRDSIPNVLA